MSKKQNKKTVKNTKDTKWLALDSPEIVAQTHKDILHSFLFLSVLFNMFAFIYWVTLEVTGAQLAIVY